MFRLLGLKMLSPDDNNTTSEDKHDVQCMQKSLFGRKDWIYFYKGVRIADNKIELPNDFECDEMLYSTNRVSLSFCAIVGKNGKGKSSAIDMVIRILNNLSAAIIGEEETFNAAERLHFISNVYAELAVLIDKRIIIISCRGGLVELKYYEGTFKSFKHTGIEEVLSWDGKIIKSNPDKYKTLKDLFYTIVFNYSMYAYNYGDYFREADRQITDINGDIKEEDIWLKGVFHKNDGYQTPIVIHPMRNDGMIDVPKENKLAKERLLSMLFYKDEEEKFPFRYINDELEIMAICLPPLEYKKFSKTKIRRTLGIKEESMSDENFKKCYRMILNSWMDWIVLPMPEEGTEALEHDYIVYKTLKIISTYKTYNEVGGQLFGIEINEEFRNLLKRVIEMMRKDTSHVTLKLRRCLFKLKFKLYVGKSRSLYNLDDAFAQANQNCNDTTNQKEWKVRLIDLLPPPTTDIHFQIVKKDKIKSNRDYEDKDIIPFEGLSSGERQIAYTVSNLMYHLINIDSVSSKYLSDKKESQDKSLLKYRYVNIMLDEVELYFHPDLQRRFLYYVKTAIDNILFESIKGINVMVVTHSPFVISDLPRKNILFLGKEKEPDPGETFCANIHDMLNQSFFMDYSIGEIARKELQHIIKLYEQRDDIDTIKNDLKENKEKYDYLSKIIADEYLKKTIGRILEELYRQVQEQEQDQEQDPKKVLEDKIQTLEEELNRLKKERGNYDKDGIQST